MFEQSFTKFFSESLLKPVPAKVVKEYKSVLPKKITKSVVKEKNDFKNYFVKRLLNEGGQAAENLLVDLKKTTNNDKLRYVRTTPTPQVINEVQALLSLLRQEGFIDSREPSYYLGSSRLFAIKAGIKAPEPDEIETKEVINKALATKKDFGDIDLDVYYNKGVTTAAIQNFLNQHSQKYAANAMGEEVNVAVIVDGTSNVIQIDVVDITGKEQYFGMSQFASMADIAVGIKGVVRDLMIRSIAASTPIAPEVTKKLDSLIKSTDEYKAFIAKYGNKGNVSYQLRYTLGGDGLAYKITWKVDDKEKMFSKGGVRFDQLQKFIKGKDVEPVLYEDLNTLSAILGFENPNDMKHVVKMAEIVSTFDIERKQKVWDTLVKNIKSKLPNPLTGRMQGQITEQEAKNAFEYLKPYFPGVNFDEYEQQFNESITLEEAVKMVSIPHIDQMTPKDFCNLFSGGAWEVSEKYDGSNVSFGLTDEGNVFVKTKRGNPVTNPEEFYQQAKSLDNDIFEGFGRLLQVLQGSNVPALLKNIQNKLGTPIQIFGEMFSKAHMNVIPYAEDLVGNGAVVVFGVVKLDSAKGTDITTTKEGLAIKSQVIKVLNDEGQWKFYDKKPLELDIDNSIKTQIQRVCSAENMAVMASRKRTGSEAELKRKAVEEFKKLQAMIKKSLLGSVGRVPSSLGAEEIEGAIIRNIQTGAIAKLVDLEGFGRRRAEQWAGVDALKDYRKALYNQLKDNVLKNADIFILNDKQVQKLTDAMETKGSRFASMDEMLDVLYGDASEEIQFQEATQMVRDLTNSLNQYKIDIEQALSKINKNDTKGYEDTVKAINIEKTRIDGFIAELNRRIKDKQNPYLSVIQFALGPKTLEELTNKFLNVSK